jgi:hypothetical protein
MLSKQWDDREKKLAKVFGRVQERIIRVTKHPVELKELDDGMMLTICPKGSDIPRLSLTAKMLPPGLVLSVDATLGDTGVQQDTMKAFTDKLKLSFPKEDDFPMVQMLVLPRPVPVGCGCYREDSTEFCVMKVPMLEESGLFYEFTVFTKSLEGPVPTWEQMHARRLIEAAMLACWSRLEPVKAIIVPGLFRKMEVKHIRVPDWYLEMSVKAAEHAAKKAKLAHDGAGK